MLGRLRSAQGVDRGVQQQRKAGQGHAVGGARRARQSGVPGGHDVGVGVLVPVPRTEEIGEETRGVRALLSLLRHHDRGRLSRITRTVASSTLRTALNASSTTPGPSRAARRGGVRQGGTRGGRRGR